MTQAIDKTNLSPRPLIKREITRKNFPCTFDLLMQGVREGVAPGMVAGIWCRAQPDEIWLGAVGNRRSLPTAQALSVDTVFDLASLTKVCATATMVARLVDRGWVQWDTPLQAFFPQADFQGITLTHLLSHTAGFLAWQPFFEQLQKSFLPEKIWNVSISARQAEMRRLVLASKPEAAPGVRVLYSDISFLLLGYVIEELTRLRLDQAVSRLLWSPMGVGMTYRPVLGAADFRRADSERENIAATEDSSWRGGMLQGQVHDDNCWAMGGFAGHAGVFGSAEDVLGFVRALHSGFLTPSTLESMWTRISPPHTCERTRGWDTPSGLESSVGSRFSAHSVGHLGYTGTSLWMDRQAGLAVTLLTNRVHPTRENTKIKAFRPLFHNALREDLRY